jgi:endogenous inhibitor of DNA gyrase (YacG/DUF329 family)
MRCPICKKSVPEPQHTAEGPSGAKPSSTFPFCSDRCKLIDLGRWLDGKYQIPAVEDDADEGSLPVSADDLAAD